MEDQILEESLKRYVSEQRRREEIFDFILI